MAYDEMLKMVDDHQYLPTEQFPRQMLFEFRDVTEPDDRDAVVQAWLLRAEPNLFPNGPVVTEDGRRQGFAVPSPLGNRLGDNSYIPDGYRFHDAMHISFAAHFGRSAVLRSLMGLKRRSNSIVDTVEDGGRAIAIEEGLVAHLGQLSLVDDLSVHKVVGDPGTISLRRSYEELSVGPPIPALSWAKAIGNGVAAMRKLHENNGGFLAVDLNLRSYRYLAGKPDKNA